MNKIRKFKNIIKSNSFLYFIIYNSRRIIQNYHIRSEQKYYESIKGIYKNENKLREISLKRGVNLPINIKNNIEFIYASFPSDWEIVNIPPQIEQISKTHYFYINSEKNINKKNALSVRSYVDKELINIASGVLSKKCTVVLISYLSGAHISTSTIETLKRMGVICISFHLDDRLYFKGYRTGDQFSGPFSVCRSYDLNLTNSKKSLIKYQALGANVRYWPEGANPEYFKPKLGSAFLYDVSFCGAKYGVRPVLINFLRSNGINVKCFGKDWESGYISNDEFIDIINSSRICLGLGYVADSDEQCLKGRDFEIPSCGAVYLTSYNDEIADLFVDFKEIVLYYSFEHCLSLIRELLLNDVLCEQIRENARKAVVTRHTWKQRFEELLID